jgi:hypothetical protein
MNDAAAVEYIVDTTDALVDTKLFIDLKERIDAIDARLGILARDAFVVPVPRRVAPVGGRPDMIEVWRETGCCRDDIDPLRPVPSMADDMSDRPVRLPDIPPADDIILVPWVIP